MFTDTLTWGQRLALIPSQSCMHMGTCAKGRFGVCGHMAILYEIVHRPGKVKQAIHDVLRALNLPNCFSSTPIWPLASRTTLGATAILAKFYRKIPFSKKPGS